MSIHLFWGNRFECDFAIPKALTIIECDGEYWHSRPDMIRRDHAKDAYAKKCGWTLVRLKGKEILDGSAINIAKRFSNYMSENGASIGKAHELSEGEVGRRNRLRKESPCLQAGECQLDHLMEFHR
jgi:Protein of unknown function (DUF559)